MNELKQKPDDRDVGLDDLVSLVEKAAGAIERMQEKIDGQHRHIKELEQAGAELEKEVEWSRWFRRKYGNTIFFSAIEKAYRDDHSAQGAEAHRCDSGAANALI